MLVHFFSGYSWNHDRIIARIPLEIKRKIAGSSIHLPQECYFSDKKIFNARKKKAEHNLVSGKGSNVNETIIIWFVRGATSGLLEDFLVNLPSGNSNQTRRHQPSISPAQPRFKPCLTAYEASCTRFSRCSFSRMFLIWFLTVFSEMSR